MTSSDIVLGARKVGKTALFMKAFNRQMKLENAEHYEKIAIDQMMCLRQMAKDKGITYEMIAEGTGISRTNIGRSFSGKHIPRYDNYLKLYHFIVGEQPPSPCDKPETAETTLAVKLLADPDLMSFEECLEEEMYAEAGDNLGHFQSIIEKAKKSYESQFEV